MPRFVDAIDLPVPIETAFDYLADFSTTAEWDPGVLEAERLTSGDVRQGSRFRVLTSICGLHFPLEYRIEEYDRPHRLVLVGGDDAVTSTDEITFAPRPGGTRVTYEARLELTGLRKLAHPIVDLLLQQIGRVAARGLRERLAAGRGAEPPSRAAADRSVA